MGGRNMKRPSEHPRASWSIRSLCFAFRALSYLFPAALSRQSLFDSFLFARLQVEGVLLNLFDDVLLLDLALEAAEGIFDRLALVQSHFSHVLNTPNLFKDVNKDYRVALYGKSNRRRIDCAIIPDRPFVL